ETYKSFQWLQAKGYQVFIYFLAVDDVEICINRVKLRVSQGGHNVNPDVIRQRYASGLALLKHYKNFPDVLLAIDNSDGALTTELELRKGIIHQQTNPCKDWVKTIVEQEPTRQSVREKESIKEVRKLYKRGKKSK